MKSASFSTRPLGSRGPKTSRRELQRTKNKSHRFRFERVPAFHFAADAAGSSDLRVVAPMPGRIVLFKVAAGDRVTAGQELGVMEAMKMELALKAPRAGVVAGVQAKAGDFVEADAVLIRLEDA